MLCGANFLHRASGETVTPATHIHVKIALRQHYYYIKYMCILMKEPGKALFKAGQVLLVPSP